MASDRKPPGAADTTLGRRIKRLLSHAEAAQAASKQAKQAVAREPGADQNEAEDEDTALRRIVQGLHESATKTAEGRALRELRRDGPALPPALAAMQEERAQVTRSAQAAREMARRQGPGENFSEAEADTDLQRIVQGLHESATRTAENRALRELRPHGRADWADPGPGAAHAPNARQAPDGDDTDETTLGRIMKRLRVRTEATQAAWSAQAKQGAGQAAGRNPAAHARQAPQAPGAAPPKHAKAMQAMQAAHAQMQQAMHALHADGGAGAKAKKDKKDKKGGFFARAFAALRGAERPRPGPPAADPQALQRVSPRELRARREAPAMDLGEELEALGGGAILSHIGFDPSTIEYVQTSLGGGVVLMDMHSGPDWRIYHFMLGASPFWLLCPKAGARAPGAGGDPRTREVVLVKKLMRALDAKG